MNNMAIKYLAGRRMQGTSAERLATVSETPVYETDFSSSTGWTQVGSWVQISGGKVVFSGGSNANNNVNRAIGTTLSNTKWVLRFKYNSKVNDFGNMVLSSGTAHPDSDNTDWIGFYAGSATNNGYALSWGDSGAMSTASWIGTSSVSANIDYWVQITRESATSAKLEMFSDSAYSVSVGTSSTTSLPSSITGISNIILASITEGGASSGYSWEIDDLEVYNDVTTVAKTANIQTNSIWEESDTGKHYIWNATSNTWSEIA
jgi:hypothetical protein